MRPLSRRGAGSTEQRQNRRPPAVGHDDRGGQRNSEADRPPQQQRAGAPWHFWLVVVMATVYLGWRAVEGIVWLIQWIADGFG